MQSDIDICLEPTKDFDYMEYLSNQYQYDNDSKPLNNKEKGLISNIYKVFINGSLSGVIFTTMIDGKLFIDGYKDQSVKNPIRTSFLVLNEFFSCISLKNVILHTLINESDKILTLFVTRAGFVKISTVNDMALYSKRV